MTGDEIAHLLARARDGDQTAWDALVDAYTNLLWSVARAHRLDTADAGDAVQTAWLRLVENLDRIHDPERLGAWLATTTRRECLRILRRSGRVVPSDEALADVPDSSAPALDARLLLEERDAALWAVFEKIPERCRRLLRVLMADPPPAYADVAEALDMPVGSIGPTRARCLERLRQFLDRTDLVPGGISTEGDRT